MTTNRVLIVSTSANQFIKAGFRTGLWLSELTHFYDVMEEGGFATDIASPTGGEVPLDPESLFISELSHMVGHYGPVSERYADRTFMDRLNSTATLEQVNASQYDALYIAGGHGAMFDLAESEAMAALATEFAQAGKVVSAVCHGPAGLLEARDDTGEYLVHGKEVTCFSWKEEQLAKRNEIVPFNLQKALETRGARYSKALLPSNSHVVEDGLLITGQNPRSAADVAEAVLRHLRGEPGTD